MTVAAPTEARCVTASVSELAGCSGLELVSRLADGSMRRPSMAETLPFTLLPPEEGKIWLLATPEPRFYNLTNTVHGGWIMTMLDTAMALAAHTTLSPGETCPSHETTAKFVRPISIDSGVMHSSAMWFRAAGPSSRWRAGLGARVAGERGVGIIESGHFSLLLDNRHKGGGGAATPAVCAC